MYQKNKDIFGSENALKIVDPSSLYKLFKSIPALRNTTDATQFLKSNKELVCTALAKRSATASTILKPVQGELPDFIEIHEHYFVTGPQKRGATRLIFEHIFKYVKWFHDTTPHIMHNLSTGKIASENIYTSSIKNFSIGDINKRKGSVLREINGAADRGDPICMHAFIKLQSPYQEKFIYLRKWFILHWKNQTSGRMEHCSDKIPQAVYEEVYFDQSIGEKSISGILESVQSNELHNNYVQNVPIQIGKCWKSGSIVETYHALISYVLLNEKERTFLLFDLTKMLRSPAQTFHHLRYENLVLQNLIAGLIDPERQLKGKITLNDVRRQMTEYRRIIEQKIVIVGKVFLSGINYEVNGNFNRLQKLIQGSAVDKQKVNQAVKLLQQLSSYMDCISACVASSIHANYPYINDIIQDCVRQYEIDLRKSSSSKTIEKGL